MNTDYAQARKNMIDCQIATMGVIDGGVLAVLSEIPRERFVPAAKRDRAYTDEDLSLGEGGFLMEPLVFARMVQAAAPGSSDKVLNVGDATGYSSAVLSRLSGSVVCLRRQADAAMGQAWSELRCGNIGVAEGALARGLPEQSPFALIFVNGAVSALPLTLISQLGEGGRLLAVLRQSPRADGKAVLITKLGNGGHSSKILFDAATPYVPEFAPESSFVF